MAHIAESPEISDPPGEAWLRARLEELAAIERPSASEGEREAAEWLAAELAEAGARQARVESEPEASGTYWWPLGLLAASGVASGLIARRGGTGSRLAAVAAGAAATALAIDELPPGGRTLRRMLPSSTAHQVLAELGPADAERTVVLMAHHDAAHSGWIFSPAIPDTINRVAPQVFEHADTSPPLMLPVIGGPGVVALGTLAGSRRLIDAGIAISAAAAASMAEIGSREVVPGANDNGTGCVALIALTRMLSERPTSSTRVLVLSTSEEALCEGMGIFMERHRDALPPDSTFFLSLDTVGSPHLCVLRGEGMLRMTEYPSASLELVDGLAAELGIELFPNLRLRNATDAVFPLNAGYQCISMASVTDLKQPANYHWRTDTPDRVDYATVADAIRLAEALIRRLDDEWI